MAENAKRSRKPLVIVLVILLIACAAAGIAGAKYLLDTYSQIRDVENAQSIEPKLPVNDKAASAQDPSKTGEINFDALQQQNPDIYSWVYIPDTGVNYPVCQSAQDNSYYLTHDASGAESQVGAIYSEAQFNHKDYQDRVTVLYGHNGYGSTMFTNLHNYERQEFLDGHDKVYVFTPEKVYTYQVFSAFTAGDRHIMDAFNFQDDEGFLSFANFLKNPGAIDAHVNDVEISAGDKLLVLSTCNTGALESTGRYLVCGVLIDEQPWQ